MSRALSVLFSLLASPPLLAMAMASMHTAGYDSDGRAPASVSRNGSYCGSGCGTFGPAVGVLVLLGLRGRRSCRLRLRERSGLHLRGRSGHNRGRHAASHHKQRNA